MDSPTRNFLGLVGISATLVAYLVCGFITYVLIPFVGLSPERWRTSAQSARCRRSFSPLWSELLPASQ